jgi:hypothetical protein
MMLALVLMQIFNPADATNHAIPQPSDPSSHNSNFMFSQSNKQSGTCNMGLFPVPKLFRYQKQYVSHTVAQLVTLIL